MNINKLVIDNLHVSIEGRKINPFTVLGIEDKYNITAKQLRDIYKKLALKYHPDKNPSRVAQIEFDIIKKCYNTIHQLFPESFLLANKQTSYKDMKAQYAEEIGTTKQEDLRTDLPSDFNEKFEQATADIWAQPKVSRNAGAAREEISVPRILKGYSRDEFNEVFEYNKQLRSKHTENQVSTFVRPYGSSKRKVTGTKIISSGNGLVHAHKKFASEDQEQEDNELPEVSYGRAQPAIDPRMEMTDQERLQLLTKEYDPDNIEDMSPEAIASGYHSNLAYKLQEHQMKNAEFVEQYWQRVIAANPFSK